MASVVTELPETLAPWSAWLKWFAPELALELGSLLQRLQPLLSPYQSHGSGGEQDWDGLDDLRTRGSYERLLTSEWLLADELPDEFLRRAASGEHMFLAPKPRQRRAQRTVIVLFDAGPLQLGAPRLAHIALWILLARRAVQVQGEMRWGVLQSPGELNEASDVQHLKALLARRSFTIPDESHLEQWRTALGQLPAPAGERWFIGSPYGSLSTASFTHRVHLQKGLNGNALDVTLLERGANRKITLPLPPSQPASALLRGSFEPILAEQTRLPNSHAVALLRPPIISIDGTRIAVTHRDVPAFTTFYVPRKPDEVARSPQQTRWSQGYSALSATLVSKTVRALIADADVLRFWPSSMILKPCPPQEIFHAPGSTSAWLPAAWLRDSQAVRLCVIDQSKRLLRWDATVLKKRDLKHESSLHLVAGGALSLAQVSSAVAAFVHYDNGHVWFSRIRASGEAEAPRVICKAPTSTVVFLGRGCFVAVRLSAEHWRLWNWNDAAVAWDAHLPGGGRVIGVMRDKNGLVGLLTLEDQCLRLYCQDRPPLLLYTAPSKIVSHCVCPNSALVAMLTLDRQLIGFSAATQELRLCVQTGRDEHADD